MIDDPSRALPSLGRGAQPTRGAGDARVLAAGTRSGELTEPAFASRPPHGRDAAATASALSLPAELLAVDQATRAALAVASRADNWDAPTRAGVLAWVAHHRDVLATFEGKVLTAERQAGTWSLRGDRDLAGFVGRTSRQGRGAGLAAVGQASTLAAMPAVAEALVDGPVTTTHVAQLTRAMAGSAALASELASPVGQERVVAMAGRLDGTEFGKALAQMSAALDPAMRQRAHDEQRANRSLAWTHTPSGTLIKGRLDSVAGHKFAKAIDALCPRPAADDDRSRQQRAADALMAIVERVATDKATAPGALAPVQAIVTFTPHTWTALRATRATDSLGDMPSTPRRAAAHRPGHPDDPTADHGASCASDATVRASAPAQEMPVPQPVPGSTADVIDRLHGVEPVVDETGQAWPASEVARALCDCALTWAVAGTPAAQLNLGRESRLFKRQHWLALYAAGVTTCAAPGCGMPLAYTELHHLMWWLRDQGPTDQNNCAPYCSFHHHEIHRLNIQVTRLPDGSLEHRHPDGRRYGAPPTPRNADGRSLPNDAAPPLKPGDDHAPPDVERRGASPDSGGNGSSPVADGLDARAAALRASAMTVAPPRAEGWTSGAAGPIRSATSPAATDAERGAPPIADRRPAAAAAPDDVGGDGDPPSDLLALLSA